MTRAIFSKVIWGVRAILWLARGTSILVGLTVMVALTAGVVSQALAANGQPLLMGVAGNSASALTKLTANIVNPTLQLVNTNTSPGATALSLVTSSSRPPMGVTSSVKVANLNSDKVDGQSFTCPTNTLFHDGVCIEKTGRNSAIFDTADDDCLDEGKRLPTVAELQTFRNRAGTDYTTFNELTSDVFVDDNTQYVTSINPNGKRTNFGLSIQLRYRCVASAS